MDRIRAGTGGVRRIFSIGNGISSLGGNVRKISGSGVEYRPAWYVLLLVVVFISLLLLYTVCFGRIDGQAIAEAAEDFNYGVVLDAGSSGTRAYLYYWPQHSGNPRDLLSIHPLIQDGEPMVKKVTPGLSSQAATPDNAFEYLRPLLMFASDNIPKEKHKETPIYILATAGMRLLDKSQQDAILENVGRGIKQNYDFYFPDGHLEIISGKQEGIYQWLSINYVLGKFNHKENSGAGDEMVAVEQGSHEKLVLRPRTVGALDMGGASMQVAMEITTDLQLEGMSEKDKTQIAEVNLGCTEHDLDHKYRVFVSTFLGFGANQALARHQRNLFIGSYMQRKPDGLNTKYRLKDPCRPVGMKENVTVNLDLENLNIPEDLKRNLSENQLLHFYGTGDWDSCYAHLGNFTRSKEPFVQCVQNCPDYSMNIPPIQFDNSEFFGFSEFWYSMDDVLRMGGSYMFYKYKTASKDFCSTRWMTTWARFKQGVYPNSDMERVRTQCFKSAWVAVALHQGLSFPLHYGHLTAAPNTVHGEVVHWTLGALLYRTRYLPLRSIGKFGTIHRHHSGLNRGYLYSPYIVWLCLFAVSSFIVLYVYRLRRYVKPSTLRRVPSLNIFQGGLSSLQQQADLEDEQENLIKKEQEYLYAHTKVFVG